MSEIVPFTNGEFNLSVTAHEADGFHVPAPEVARALGFRDAYRLTESIPDDEKGYTTARTSGGDQRILYLTEAGFYRALGQRQSARITDETIRALVERFQTWVYRDVLPALRRGEVAVPARRTGELVDLDVLRHAIDHIAAMRLETAQAVESADAAKKDALNAHDLAERNEARLDAMEGRHDWVSGLGFARLHGLSTSSQWLQKLGKTATDIAKAEGIEPVKVPHAYYGSVNSYPEWVWQRAHESRRNA